MLIGKKIQHKNYSYNFRCTNKSEEIFNFFRFVLYNMKVILTLTKTIMANYFKLFGIALLRTISNLKISAIHLVSLLSF